MEGGEGRFRRQHCNMCREQREERHVFHQCPWSKTRIFQHRTFFGHASKVAVAEESSSSTHCNRAFWPFSRCEEKAPLVLRCWAWALIPDSLFYRCLKTKKFRIVALRDTLFKNNSKCLIWIFKPKMNFRYFAKKSFIFGAKYWKMRLFEDFYTLWLKPASVL